MIHALTFRMTGSKADAEDLAQVFPAGSNPRGCSSPGKPSEPKAIGGGELKRLEAEIMRDRIPPKTWKWINDYFQCARYGQLFWRGTHWQRIQTALDRLVPEKVAG